MKVSLNKNLINNDDIMAALTVLQSGFVTQGNKVKEFEEAFAKYVGSKHAIMVNSGSSANLLMIGALRSHLPNSKLKADDKLIVPAVTWSTNIAPLVQYGLVPLFVDIDYKTLNIDIDQVEAAIVDDIKSERKAKIKAILVTHVLGNPCDMFRLKELADKYNLILLEDSCEAMGVFINSVGVPKYNKHVGTFGDVGTFSFYFSHHMTTIEGGMIVTDDGDIADVCRCLRSHGWIRDMCGVAPHTDYISANFEFIEAGYNVRSMELNAAIGLEQLKRLDDSNSKRKENAVKMADELEKVSSDLVLFGDWIDWPTDCVPMGFPVLVKNREEFNDYLNKNGIETRPIIAGNIVRQPFMQEYNFEIHGDANQTGRLINANRIHDEGLYWACHPLMTDAEIEHIIATVKGYYSKG